MQSGEFDPNDISFASVLGGTTPSIFAGFYQEIVPSADHAVLYQLVRDMSNQDSPPLPVPVPGQPKWDADHVRMPHSKESLHEVSQQKLLGIKMSSTSVVRWTIIEKALQKKINSSFELAQAILSYNTKYEKVWKFQDLHQFLNEYLSPGEAAMFFHDTLPKMTQLALDLPYLVQAPIPLLKQKQNKSVSLSQKQIASLLANAFFCTFPWRNNTAGTEYAKYPKINFSSLYESNGVQGTMEKLKCIFHYFIRVCDEQPTGVVTISRRCVPEQNYPIWESSIIPISSVPVYVTSDIKIEDAQGLIQVDFANEVIAKGVLGRGLLQEEIRFLISPELMIAMLFTEAMESNEAVMIQGTERFSNYTGYGRDSFRWIGDHRDSTPMDKNRRRRGAVLAIDALYHKNPQDQFQKQRIIRDLKKAWTGFSFFTDHRGKQLNYPGVATGNWGCGAFHGSPQLKSLIQIMAGAQARRPLAYCTYRDAELKDSIIQVYNVLKRHNITVGQLYEHIMKSTNREDLFQVLRDLEPPARIGPKILVGYQDTHPEEPAYHLEPSQIYLRQQSAQVVTQLLEKHGYIKNQLENNVENRPTSSEGQQIAIFEKQTVKLEDNRSHEERLTNYKTTDNERQAATTSDERPPVIHNEYKADKDGSTSASDEEKQFTNYDENQTTVYNDRQRTVTFDERAPVSHYEKKEFESIDTSETVTKEEKQFLNCEEKQPACTESQKTIHLEEKVLVTNEKSTNQGQDMSSNLRYSENDEKQSTSFVEKQTENIEEKQSKGVDEIESSNNEEQNWGPHYTEFRKVLGQRNPNSKPKPPVKPKLLEKNITNSKNTDESKPAIHEE